MGKRRLPPAPPRQQLASHATRAPGQRRPGAPPSYPDSADSTPTRQPPRQPPRYTGHHMPPPCTSHRPDSQHLSIRTHAPDTTTTPNNQHHTPPPTPYPLAYSPQPHIREPPPAMPPHPTLARPPPSDIQHPNTQAHTITTDHSPLPPVTYLPLTITTTVHYLSLPTIPHLLPPAPTTTTHHTASTTTHYSLSLTTTTTHHHYYSPLSLTAHHYHTPS